MEALCAAGLDCERVPTELRERARRCAWVLGLLGSGPAPDCDQSLIDATLVRVAWSRRSIEDARMGPLDEDALEALIGAGFDPAKCPAGVRERARTHARMLSVLDVPIATADREVLIGRTLSSVQSAIEGRESRFRMEPAQARARLSFRWSDLISVAALLLIASAVIVPMVGTVRNYSRTQGCEAGLAGAFHGFSGYANDFRESLPLASSSQAGQPWWEIGKPERSNSANLFTLLREKYAASRDLACPGNAGACREAPAPGAMDWSCSDAISYSYQNQFTPDRLKWTQPAVFVILADRSPVIVRAMRNEWINPLANSDNHEGRGQKVLFSDGTVHWMKTPVLASGDNIWLPRGLEEIIAHLQNPTRAAPLRGNESPSGKLDVFLSP
jgi:hypothetical protein